MPYATKEMIEAIQASTPEWKGRIDRLHYTLGSDFDEFLFPEDPADIFKPMSPEKLKRYEEKLAEAMPAIIEGLISAHLQIHGPSPTAKPLEFGDSWQQLVEGETVDQYLERKRQEHTAKESE